MTDFTPQHYLAAARIAYPDGNWRLSGGTPIDIIDKVPISFILDDGDDKCALREALDMRHIHIKPITANLWVAKSPIANTATIIKGLEARTSTDLMMKVVAALVEAGVVE